MCVNYFLFSILLILNTEIQCENSGILEDTLALSTNYFNMKVPSLSTLPEESKRVIYRDIKNQIESESRRRLARSKKKHLPRLPSFYLEPPPINQNYNNYKKFIDNKRKKIRTSTTPKSSSEEESHEEIPNYVRDHAPAESKDPEESETTERRKEKDEEEEEGTTDSAMKERINFHIHGHEGPDTYVFGYDTGNGDNRQFRFEERHGNGTVTGQYGYYDTRGQLRKMYYTANPINGYESFPVIEDKDE